MPITKKLKIDHLLFILLLISFVATTGSLFFSEVMEFTPCSLCWYQRIAMYPLVIIFAVAFWFNDSSCLRYANSFIYIGFIISVYHNLLVHGIVPESASPCVQGVSCATTWINLFGFITIPFLSLIAFILLLITSITLNKKNKDIS